MIQHALRLIKLGIEYGLKQKFGAQGLSLLSDIRKIGDVQQLKKILHALPKVSSAEDLKKLILGAAAPQSQALPPPPTV